MSWFKWQSEAGPITDALRRAAAYLNVKVDENESDFLLQSRIIEELARRVWPHLK